MMSHVKKSKCIVSNIDCGYFWTSWPNLHGFILARAEGGMQPLMSFYEMGAEPQGGSR